ncbi:MAG: alanine racemase [SAR86 cluster bacterium]|uniref:Alanine racemase n=1 Tax=SAR86 cluster bacterium TaxID=2030880 RepID=A0A2A4MMX6_9GAMM|nr:MAG: alanine racemase [SAR86 cluster bacterium]
MPLKQESLRAWADIDLQAVISNLQRVSRHCPAAKTLAVIKADAYGHGMAQVAEAINKANAQGLTEVDCLAVATLDEALSLKRQLRHMPVLLLTGYIEASQLQSLLEHNIEFVIHSLAQLKILLNNSARLTQASTQAKTLANTPVQSHSPRRLWLKFDSGMHRLGLAEDDCVKACAEILALGYFDELVLMSHLSSADDVTSAVSVAYTDNQVKAFTRCYQKLLAQLEVSNKIQALGGEHSSSTKPRPAIKLSTSLCASSGIVALQECYDYVRPGIMLYGGAGSNAVDAEALGPAMTLKARLIAIKTLKAGDAIGYGATYTCATDMCVGVVSIGYADGYPRSANSATEVLVHSTGESARAKLLGRVSMDMISVDLSNVPHANVGDVVTLWGAGLPVDEVAKSAGTISYDLLCRVSAREPRIYSH